MNYQARKQLVYTVKDRCRVCFTCVRECPVKAIRINNGQAEVMNERCIACGNCVKVCSQGAKIYLDGIEEAEELLRSSGPVAACIAPSFPAEFTEITDHTKLVGMIRELGFDYVVEVGFGADMVSIEYNKLFDNPKSPPVISSDCPAIVYYIEHYHPNLVPSLAPVASPMVATTRIIRELYGSETRVIFIGPCIAKKAESTEVDAVLTYAELRKMFSSHKIVPAVGITSDFDPPHAGKGAIYPVSRGMLQTVNNSDDIFKGNIVVAEGRENYKEAIQEFECGSLKHHLELLSCEGCIMGPGMSQPNQKYSRRSQISNYAKKKLGQHDHLEWEKNVRKFSDLDFSEQFYPRDRRLPLPTTKEIDEVLLEMGKTRPEDHLNCGACGYPSCTEHAIAIIEGLAEIEMCLPYTIEKLHLSIKELNLSNEKLANARQALKQSEKLASMGQLSAGIAHELNNPLGVITMYANILLEESDPDDPERKDLELIVEQTNRCKNIVGGLLNFARKNQVKKTETNMETFCQKSLQSVIIMNNISLKFHSEMLDPIAMVDQDQFMQVLTNLEKNAVEAMPGGGTLSILLKDTPEEVLISISDTGLGISPENIEKVFTPFFTTKEVGKGTGLGLPLVFGIVKMHKGKINVESNTEPSKGPVGTCFRLTIPRI
ncbi:MAG: 4Fe-4S dicluster domain-containing protein [Bacteroidales bacterium]|nr:4Fe-4S dicluster domain-containing protein [Bacteroidales bacterium]